MVEKVGDVLVGSWIGDVLNFRNEKLLCFQNKTILYASFLYGLLR